MIILVTFVITCLVESRSQEVAANEIVLSVLLTPILYHHHVLFIDIERENIPGVHSQCFIIELPATINLYKCKANDRRSFLF